MSDPIEITEMSGTWVIRAGGAVLGETQNALQVTQSGHDAAVYFPRADIAMAMFEQSDTTKVCPYKGNATYYALQTKSMLIEDAAWSYEAPKPGYEQIAGYLSFHTDKVVVEEI